MQLDDARAELLWTLEAPLRAVPFLLERIIMNPDHHDIVQPDDETTAHHVLLCPHGKETYALDMLGVRAYYHKEDDVSCQLLNTFKTSCDDVLDAMIQSRVAAAEKLQNTPTVRAILTLSQKARIKVYERLSRAKDADLAELLEIVYLIYTHSRQYEMLIQELVTQFGKPVIRNILMLFQKDLGSRHVTKTTYRPMQDLKAEYVRGIQELIKEEKAKPKNKQSLKDIVY